MALQASFDGRARAGELLGQPHQCAAVLVVAHQPPLLLQRPRCPVSRILAPPACRSCIVTMRSATQQQLLGRGIDIELLRRFEVFAIKWN